MAGTGNRDQLRPFPQGRRLPAAPVPVRCRAGLLLLAALGAGGRPPDRQGRDLPAPRARARVTVEGVNAPAKACDIRHHPHLPPKLPDGPVPPAKAPRQAPCTGTERGPATPDTICRPPGECLRAGRDTAAIARRQASRGRTCRLRPAQERSGLPARPPSPTRSLAPSRPCSPTPPAKTPVTRSDFRWSGGQGDRQAPSDSGVRHNHVSVVYQGRPGILRPTEMASGPL